MSRLRVMLLAASLCAAAGSAAAENELTPRRGELNCGSSLVTALSMCYGDSRLCARETLTFRRPGGSTVLAPHPRTENHRAPAGGKVAALDYRATSWACTAGATGGRYVAVIMVRTNGVDCGECQYIRLYHPEGQVIATTLKFDAAGRPSEDAQGTALIKEILGRPWPEGLKLIYYR